MVPKRLKEAREAALLSQEQLALLAGIEGLKVGARVSNYESGRFSPPFSFIQKVAKILDYPEGYFYTSDDGFALAMLALYRQENGGNINRSHYALIEVKKMSEEIKKLSIQLDAYVSGVV